MERIRSRRTCLNGHVLEREQEGIYILIAFPLKPSSALFHSGSLTIDFRQGASAMVLNSSHLCSSLPPPSSVQVELTKPRKPARVRFRFPSAHVGELQATRRACRHRARTKHSEWVALRKSNRIPYKSPDSILFHKKKKMTARSQYPPLYRQASENDAEIKSVLPV